MKEEVGHQTPPCAAAPRPRTSPPDQGGQPSDRCIQLSRPNAVPSHIILQDDNKNTSRLCFMLVMACVSDLIPEHENEIVFSKNFPVFQVLISE
jgi:hypothetical protein